jgi:CubicO group peptidase (beta-lactamase class C family)
MRRQQVCPDRYLGLPVSFSRKGVAVRAPALLVFACALGCQRNPPAATRADAGEALLPATRLDARDGVELRVLEGAPPPPAFDDPARRAKLATAYPKLEEYFAGFYAKKKLPGLVVGLVIDGELAWSHGYGVKDLDGKSPVDADTIYRIGSITKSFTAVAVLRLRDAGKVSLDVPAATYLPDLAGVLYPTADAPPITVRHLLTHTSGLPNVGALDANALVATEAYVLGALHGLRLRSVPGVTKSYSSLGFGLLGILVARLSKEPFRDVIDAEVLRPLGMTATTWDENLVPRERLATAYRVQLDDSLVKVAHWKTGAFEGAGNLYSSVRDMARYLAFHLDAWPPREGQDAGPLRRSSLREMQELDVFEEVRLSRDGDPPAERVVGTGLAWGSQYWCGVGPSFNHSGGSEGYSSNVIGFPEHGVGIVWLTNEFAPNGNVFDGVRWADVIKILRATGGFERRVAPPNPALTGVRDHLTKLLFVHFDDQEAAALFGTPNEPLAPPRWIRDRLGGVRERHGACTFERDLPPHHAMEARWRMSCERGTIELHADVATISPLVIDGRGWGFSIDDVPEGADAGAPADPRCAR